jgi:hypothetical protein
MESSLLRLCIFQTALKNTFFPWYYFRTLEGAGKDMVSLGGYIQAVSATSFYFFKLGNICKAASQPASFMLAFSFGLRTSIASKLFANTAA